MSWFPDIGIKPCYQDGQLTLFNGDCREVLRSIPDESIHCVVTSPPYWGIRDYGIGSDALGLEPTPYLFVQHLVEVFREVHRVLRKDGTLWLNLGDSYAAQGDRSGGNGYNDGRTNRSERFNAATPTGLKPKDLIGMPWRVAFALQADGWYLRSDIIWRKPNPMPESVTDRPTSAHEYLFLLTRSKTYFYDADAIREPNSPDSHGSPNINPGQKSETLGQQQGGYLGYWTPEAANGRNKRTVWTIATQPYPEAHFATFPKKLVEPCVFAGTSAWGVCPKCGAPWERIVERESMEIRRTDWGEQAGNRTASSGTMVKPPTSKTTGWRKTCRHIADPVPATVLDPFSGSGTTLLVANNLGRRALGIEANEDYCKMSVKRFGQGTMHL